MAGSKRPPDGHVPPAGTALDGQRRTDWDAHRAQVRAANRARYRATQLLKAAHPEEYELIYALIGAQQDPPVRPQPRSVRVEEMEEELAELQERLAELQEGG